MWQADHLAGPLDTFPDTEVAENPGDPQGDDQVCPQTARLVNLQKLNVRRTFLETQHVALTNGLRISARLNSQLARFVLRSIL